MSDVRPRRVGLIAPSGFLPDTAVIDRAAQFFARRGWQVHASDTCFERHLRFAGPDELRAAELQRFCTDRGLDLVLAARGGYGLTRVLARLDFEAIARTDPTLCGYSDFTALNLAYLATVGGASLHGPSAGDFGTDSPDNRTIAHFFAACERAAGTLNFITDSHDIGVTGLLWGGNLAMVCALLGTPWFPKVRGGVLFLEDVNEPAYKIERMLLQLADAGVLGRQRALVLGAFEPMTPMPNDNGFSLGHVIALIRSRVPVPVLTGLPFGHVPHKVTLPVGVKVELTVKDQQATLSWRAWR